LAIDRLHVRYGEGCRSSEKAELRCRERIVFAYRPENDCVFNDKRRCLKDILTDQCNRENSAYFIRWTAS